MDYKWFILGQDYNSPAAAIQEKQVREAIGEKCKIRETASGKWQLLIWSI
jgi:hypothetical protein